MGRTAVVTFLSQSDGRNHTPRDLTLFYVVQGMSEITTRERTRTLRHEDLLALNPGDAYTLRISSGVIARIAFHHEEVYALLKGELRQVRCCSTDAPDGSCHTLRLQVQALLDALLLEELGSIVFEQHSCALLLTLLSDFSVVSGKPERKQAVEQWVENMSREPVTLEEAAEHFHLTPTYFSRWFTAAFDCNFLRYLSRVRCQKARKDLLKTDASMLRIAMDQGFPNAASFTRAFSQEYGETPLQYRKNHAVRRREGVLTAQEVAPYLRHEADSSQRQAPALRIDCAGDHEPLDPYWSELLCLGELSMLADLELQIQVQALQEQLRFRFVRLNLTKGRHEGFYQEDRAMRFLLEQGMTPFFVVEAGTRLTWLRELLRHLLQRFGLRRCHVEARSARLQPAEYRDFVHSLRGLFQSLGLDCVLYGPGQTLDAEGANLSACLRARPELDRVSIRCAPVGIVREPGLQVRPIPESDYLLHQYRLGQEILRQQGRTDRLCLTGWRTSLGGANVMNDSSWMAARLVRTALTGYGVLPALPLECPLEVLGELNRPDATLAGREGLLTLNRLPKPAFYALRFLRHLNLSVVYRDRNMIVTASPDGYVQIVLQNSAPLSYQYYLMDDETIARPVPIPHTFYESLSPWQVRLRLTGVRDGQWMMKTRIVNDTLGSLFHAWMFLNYQNDTFLGRDEGELLRAKALPDIRGNTLTARKGVLDVPVDMAPNEIRHIHLLPIQQ